MAEADLRYKHILREYAQARHGKGGAGFFDHSTDTFNQFQWYVDYLRLQAGHVYTEETAKSLL